MSKKKTYAWEQRKLEDIADVSIGEFVIKSKQNDDAPYPVFNGGKECTGYYDEFNNEANKIVISARGANAGFVNIVEKRFWAGNSCYSISIKDEKMYHLYFLYQFIKFEESLFTEFQQAANIPSVSKKDVLFFSVVHPLFEEQNEIGNFYRDLDSLITLHQRKYDALKSMKKTLLSKMFPKNGEDVPEIRFKEFTDAWEQRKLGDVKDVRDGTHDSPKYIPTGYPLVTSKNLTENGLDYSDISYISEDDFFAINKRSKVEIGDIIFGMIGTIGNPVMVKSEGFAIKNVALLKNNGIINNSFLIHLLKSPIFTKYIKLENAGGTQKFLGLSQIRNFECLIPNEGEQVILGDFFLAVDNLITLHQRKLEELKNMKKTLLQQMFV